MTWQMVSVLIGSGVALCIALLGALVWLVRELARIATLIPGLQTAMQQIVAEVQRLTVQVARFEERLGAIEERMDRNDDTPLPRRR